MHAHKHNTQYTNHWAHKAISKPHPQAFSSYNTPAIGMDTDCLRSLFNISPLSVLRIMKRSLTKPQIFNKVCRTRQWKDCSQCFIKDTDGFYTHFNTGKKKQMMRKEYQSGDVALHPLPSAWTFDTDRHTASVNNSSSSLRLEKHCCVTFCWKVVSSYHHLSI